MIDVEKEIEKVRGSKSFEEGVELFEDLVRRLAAERDLFRYIAYKIENEWRNRETWIGDKRPPQIRIWVDKEAAELMEGKK